VLLGGVHVVEGERRGDGRQQDGMGLLVLCINPLVSISSPFQCVWWGVCRVGGWVGDEPSALQQR